MMRMMLIPHGKKKTKCAARLSRYLSGRWVLGGFAVSNALGERPEITVTARRDLATVWWGSACQAPPPLLPPSTASWDSTCSSYSTFSAPMAGVRWSQRRPPERHNRAPEGARARAARRQICRVGAGRREHSRGGCTAPTRMVQLVSWCTSAKRDRANTTDRWLECAPIDPGISPIFVQAARG